MTEQRVYWVENSKGEMERVETRDVDIIPDMITEQYRVVGKTKGGHIETSVPECYYNGAKRTKEFWDKTKYYKKTWIQKRIIGEWTDDEQSNRQGPGKDRQDHRQRDHQGAE